MGAPVNVFSQALSERLCKLAIDFNNDLGVISGHCQLMLGHPGLSAESAQRLRQILVAVSKMANRINGHDCGMTCSSAQADLGKPLAGVTHPGIATTAVKIGHPGQPGDTRISASHEDWPMEQPSAPGDWW